MRRLEEILVATDLSEESAAAIPLSRSLADAAGARLALVTIVDVVASVRAF